VKKIVILISGRGSNMEAIVRAGLPAQVGAVISNRPDAAGLKFAAQAGVETQVVDERAYASRDAFEGELAAAIDRDFGGFDEFKRQLTQAASSIMGSGWAALVWEPLGHRLLTTQIYDADNRLTETIAPSLPPVVTLVDPWRDPAPSVTFPFETEKEVNAGQRQVSILKQHIDAWGHLHEAWIHWHVIPVSLAVRYVGRCDQRAEHYDTNSRRCCGPAVCKI